MATTLKLIKETLTSTNNQLNISKRIVENFNYFTFTSPVNEQSPITLAESVTHVLAGLAQNSKNMNPRSVASFLAGVEQLSRALAQSQDEKKTQNTIRVLADAALKHDELTKQSLPNNSVVVIAQYGAKFPELMQKYERIVNDPQQLDQAARQLSGPIERAMNISTQPQQQQPQPQQQQPVEANTQTFSTAPSTSGAIGNQK